MKIAQFAGENERDGEIEKFSAAVYLFNFWC